MRFELTVALRFLREGRFQSLLIIFGVAAGVAVVTYISALVEGLQGNTIAKTLGNQAHVVLKPREEVARPSLAPQDASRHARPATCRWRHVCKSPSSRDRHDPAEPG